MSLGLIILSSNDTQFRIAQKIKNTTCNRNNSDSKKWEAPMFNRSAKLYFI